MHKNNNPGLSCDSLRSLQNNEGYTTAQPFPNSV
jgi:hypothetical protein